jgi:hypothetical protein
MVNPAMMRPGQQAYQGNFVQGYPTYQQQQQNNANQFTNFRRQ